MTREATLEIKMLITTFLYFMLQNVISFTIVKCRNYPYNKITMAIEATLSTLFPTTILMQS